MLKKGGDLPLLTNAIKLRLYGYYKCATTSAATATDIVGNDYTKTKSSRTRPLLSSLVTFNPIQRAKENAILDCYEELLQQHNKKQCCTDTTTTTTTSSRNTSKEIQLLAMKCYIELIAHYSTDCANIYNSLLVQMDEFLQLQQNNDKDGGGGDNNDVNNKDVNADDDNSNQQLKVGERSVEQQQSKFIVKEQQSNIKTQVYK